MFEVSAISCQYIIISLEHPFEESMATVEINLTDLTNVTCKIYSLAKNYDHIAVKLSTIIQKSMSIPITMRALIKYWEQDNIQESLQRNNDNGNFNSNLGPSDPGGRISADFNRDMKNVAKSTGNNSSTGFNGNGSNVRGMFHPTGGASGVGDVVAFSEQNLNNIFNTNDSTLLGQLSTGNSQESCGSGTSDMSSPKIKKRRTNLMNEDFWRSPKSNKTDMEILLECSNNSSDSNSLGTSASILSETGVATPSDNDTVGLDPSSDTRTMSDDGELSDSEVSKKLISTCNMSPSVSITPIPNNMNTVITGMNLERRPGIEIIPYATQPAPNVPSSITITPINTPASMPSSSKSSSDKKSTSSSSNTDGHTSSSSNKRRRSSDEKRQEKKKKRKRDDSPMGPPDKLPPKTDPLNKPVTVSIKTSDGSPVSPTGILKKISSSSPGSKSSTNTSSSAKSSPKNSPVYHGSPKHSSSSSSSPKHSSGSGKPSMSTLKSATNSPKSEKSKSSSASSSSSASRDREKSEKKSAAATGSGSSSPKIKPSSVKLKQLDLNLLTSMDLITTTSSSTIDNQSSPTDLTKPSNNPTRNKKGSALSAVIDKLKSAQNVSEESLSPTSATPPVSLSKSPNLSSSSNSVTITTINPNKERTPTTISSIKQDIKTSNSSTVSRSNPSGSSPSPQPLSLSTKSSEYMVKPSSDGMKITINKTRTKESSSSSKEGSSGKTTSASTSSSKPSGSSGSSAKKSSGYASLQKSNSSGNLSIALKSSSSSSSSKSSFPKTMSSGNLSTSTGSASISSEYSKKDKQKPKSSSTANEDRSKYRQNDSNDVMRMLGFASTAQATEGFIKFQIPKLSARSSNATTEELKRESKSNTSPLPSTSDAPVLSTDARKKMLVDLLSKELPQKFAFTSSGKISPAHNPQMKINSAHASSFYPTNDFNFIKEFHPNKINAIDNTDHTSSMMLEAPLYPMSNTSTTVSNSIDHKLSPAHQITRDDKCAKLMRPPSAPPISNMTMSHTKQLPLPTITPNSFDEALDFSTHPNSTLPTSAMQSVVNISKDIKNLPIPIRKSTPPQKPPPTFPASPSLSVHIVKSPVPSPLMVIPSPHSNSSPCITDDELMDEALMGISGK